MGFLEHNEDLHGYIANQTAMLPIFEWFSTLPVLEKVMRLPGISQLAMPKPTDAQGAGLLMGYDLSLRLVIWYGANNDQSREENRRTAIWTR